MSRHSCSALIALALGLAATPPTGAQVTAGPPPRGPWVPSWTVLYGGYRQVGDLAAAGPGEAWGIDVAGIGTGSTARLQTAFVHWQGDVWRVAQIADDVGLESVAMVGPAFGLAVGRAGATYRFDGSRWQSMSRLVGRDLNDVALLGRDEGWAVGDWGTILRWDGVEWSRAESPLDFARLMAVAIVAPGEAWAISNAGDVLHYSSDESDEGAWQTVTAPRIRNLVDLAFEGPDHGLAVGSGVLELRSGTWRQLTVDFNAVGSVVWAGATAHVVADGRLLTYAAGQWRPVDLAPGPVDLSSYLFRRVVAGTGGVWGLETDGTTVWIADSRAHFAGPAIRNLEALDVITSTIGWAGGEAVTAGFVGTADGTSVQTPSLPVGTRVWDIDLVSETDGWAVGYEAGDPESPLAWRWDGTEWADWPIDKVWRPLGIDMLAADEGWISGANLIARWDGASWQQVPDAPTGAMTGVLSMLAGGESPEGWFGSFGAIYHLHDGQWAAEPLPEQVLIQAIDMLSQHEGWAVSTRSLFRYDGQDWRKVNLPASAIATIQDLDVPEPGNAWLLVDPDGLFHWTGVGWELHPQTGMGAHARPNRLRVVRAAGQGPDTDIWLSGESPLLARYSVVVPRARVYLPLTGPVSGG